MQAQEISHLIACQPTALKAVRLQALLPAYPDIKDKGDALDKLDVSIDGIKLEFNYSHLPQSSEF